MQVRNSISNKMNNSFFISDNYFFSMKNVILIFGKFERLETLIPVLSGFFGLWRSECLFEI